MKKLKDALTTAGTLAWIGLWIVAAFWLAIRVLRWLFT